MGAYNVIMDRPNTTILDYAMMSKSFLKSTSSWSERHIVAFRCLILENLPISRILPASDLPPDDDETMKLVIKYLSDSEDDVRSGRSLASLGPASLFYQQLQVVLRRPATPPDAIPIPRTLRQSTLLSVFPSIPESDTTTTTDSSFEPSQEHRLPVPDRPPSSMDITDSQPSHGQSSTRSSMDVRSSSIRRSTEHSTRPRASMESHNTNTSSSNASGLEEDKLETCANQAVVSFLGLLCMFEHNAQPSSQRRLSFRLSGFSNHR